MKSLLEDNHVLVLCKTAGQLTQDSPLKCESLESSARAWIKERDSKPGAVFLQAVHRLDKDVGGIVLFAKTSKAARRLNEAQRERLMYKRYLAWVFGKVSSSEATLTHKLVKKERFAEVSERGKPSELKYRVIDKCGMASLLSIELVTGRYHQIRVQLAAAGFPILGDRKYGSREAWQAPGIALHHVELHFPHPVLGAMQKVHAPLPPSWP